MAATVAVSAGLANNATQAGEITARIVDRDGQPVPEVAVFARAVDAHAQPASMKSTAPSTMNQRGSAFDPHLLIVPTGTRVEFPNGDDLRHHVYSFSPAARFNFSIDAGSVHEALQFDTPGVVTLGCNIHDDMLGYILVVETSAFGKTDQHGMVSLSELPPGRYHVEIWTPRISSKRLPEAVLIDVPAETAASFEYQFDTKLYPPHRHSATSLEWGAY